jgi:tyrosyl-tRNA synthetase
MELKKMSKSLDNYIGLKEDANSMFGKLMSISDELMWKYFELLSFKTNKELRVLKNSQKNGENPMNIKYLLSLEIVERFHGNDKAQKALKEFKNRFSKKNAPSKIEEVILKIAESEISLINLLAHEGLGKDILCNSKSEARRMIKQSAVKVDSRKVVDENHTVRSGSKNTYQVGKHRYLKIVLVKA